MTECYCCDSRPTTPTMVGKGNLHVELCPGCAGAGFQWITVGADRLAALICPVHGAQVPVDAPGMWTDWGDWTGPLPEAGPRVKAAIDAYKQAKRVRMARAVAAKKGKASKAKIWIDTRSVKCGVDQGDYGRAAEAASNDEHLKPVDLVRHFREGT